MVIDIAIYKNPSLTFEKEKQQNSVTKDKKESVLGKIPNFRCRVLCVLDG